MNDNGRAMRLFKAGAAALTRCSQTSPEPGINQAADVFYTPVCSRYGRCCDRARYPKPWVHADLLGDCPDWAVYFAGAAAWFLSCIPLPAPFLHFLRLPSCIFSYCI